MYLMTLVMMTICVSYTYSDNINETIHIRVKRGKYYSSAPPRFYRRPPNTYPVKGAFSYTPPPSYMMDDEESPHSGRPKVSRPKDGLGDEDINNLVKYLSKQDLDKIIEFAGEKERFRDNYIEKKPFKREESISKYIQAVQEFPEQQFSENPYRSTDSGQKFNINGPYRTHEHYSPSSSFNDHRHGDYKSNTDQRHPYKPQNDKHYNDPYAANEDLLNFVEDATQSKVIYVNHDHDYSSAPLQTEESMQSKQISYLNTYIHHEINGMTPGPNVFADSQTIKEEFLPRPVNLREDDFDISYTNNVPTVVKGPSSSYEVKNFGELPLMSNNYKLDTVSSYKVPHYTITSNTKYGAPRPSFDVPLEPAPPKSEAKEQSDAHLKAIKIWTHRSKGTAYTLHNDGSLSLERPTRLKTKYGP